MFFRYLPLILHVGKLVYDLAGTPDNMKLTKHALKEAKKGNPDPLIKRVEGLKK
jgi:hypothetical protein